MHDLSKTQVVQAHVLQLIQMFYMSLKIISSYSVSYLANKWFNTGKYISYFLHSYTKIQVYEWKPNLSFVNEHVFP